MSSTLRHSTIVADISAARRSSELIIAMFRSASSIFSAQEIARASPHIVTSSEASRAT